MAGTNPKKIRSAGAGAGGGTRARGGKAVPLPTPPDYNPIAAHNIESLQAQTGLLIKMPHADNAPLITAPHARVPGAG